MNLLSDEQIEAFRGRTAQIPHPREMVVDVLRAVQDRCGWVPDEGVELTADILDLSPLQVEEIATFYDKIFRSPVGKRVIYVCDSICCWTRGGEQLMTQLKQSLGIVAGETTSDGIFTLLPTCCLGACGEAPAMMIGTRTYGQLTIEKIEAILENERQSVTEG